MKIKGKDTGLILSLVFIIAVGAYWLMLDLRNNNFDQYLSLLGEKLLAMIPESSEKRTIENMFTDFKQDVKEKKITPEQVEQVAAGIMNITNMSDTVSVDEAQAILDIAGDIKHPNASVSGPMPVENSVDEMKWKKMQERLKSMYLFNEELKKRMQKIDEEPYLLYNVGNELQVIIDSKIKSDSLLQRDSILVNEMRQLEKDKLIIWHDNFEKEIQDKLKDVEKKMKLINKNSKALDLARIKILGNLEIINSIDGLDSLKIKADINFDSLEIPSIDIRIDP